LNILNWYELLAKAKIDIIDASAVRSDIFGHCHDQPVLFEDLVRTVCTTVSFARGERVRIFVEKDRASDKLITALPLHRHESKTRAKAVNPCGANQ
jgi:hypothetical protein